LCGRISLLCDVETGLYERCLAPAHYAGFLNVDVALAVVVGCH